MLSHDKNVPACCRTVCFNDEKIHDLRRRLTPETRLQRLAEWHKALGHPVRLTIVRVLAMEDCCVCDLANILAQPVSTVSQHLKTLRQSGLVAARQEGKLVICSLSHSDLWDELALQSKVYAGE